MKKRCGMAVLLTCSGVLWAQIISATWGVGPWEPISGQATRDECITVATRITMDLAREDKQYDMNLSTDGYHVTLREPTGQTEDLRLRCLPDTIDPRGAKSPGKEP